MSIYTPSMNYRSPETILQVANLSKSFILHQQGGVSLPVIQGVSFQLNQGESLVLSGASGSGKSTLIRCIYGNYRPNNGEVWVKHEGNWLDLCQLAPHELLAVRQKTIGYVSQFLRVIPRVPRLS